MIRATHVLFALASLTLALGACAGDYSANGSPSSTVEESGNVGFGGSQDIGQFRDILARGGVPTSSTLNANGFFNEHYTELPPADCGQALCLHGMVSVNPGWSTQAATTVVRVALNTTITPEDLGTKPRDIIVVVDTSGSMLDDDRMAYVKAGMDLLIDELGENDRIGIVSYASSGRVEAELGMRTKAELHNVVAGLRAAGGTNIYEGLEMGMLMAAESLSAERQVRVILLSDGNITAGPGANDVTAMSETFVAEGIGLTTIGVGNYFNLELMQGLAESGSGNFYYLENPAAVNEVFTEELAYFSEPIALGLEISVQSAESHQIGEVVGSTLWQAGEADAIDGGVRDGSLRVPGLFLSSRVDTEPGENGRRGGGSSIYLALDRVEGVAVGDSLATVTASFRLPGSDEVITQEIAVINAVGDELPEGGYVSHLEMLKAYAVYNFFVGLRQACQQAEIDRSEALKTVVALQESAIAWNARVPDADISDDLDILARLEANLGGRPYDYGDDSNEYGEGDDIYIDQDPMMCSSAGSSAGSLGFAFLLLACLARLRRRTR